MENCIVYLSDGHVRINRKVVERGYQLRLRCYLERPSVAGLERQALIQQLAANTEKILNGLQHPGYYRVGEFVNSDGTYTLHIVPGTRSAMESYLANFVVAEEGTSDLEAAINLIDNELERNAALTTFIELLDDRLEAEIEDEEDY